MSISETLRVALQDSKLSRYAVSQASGINQSILSRFVKGRRGLTAETAEKLANALGFELLCVKTKLQVDYRQKGD